MILLQTRLTPVHFAKKPPFLHKPSAHSSLYFPTSKKSALANPSVVSELLTEKHQISPPVALRVASALNHLKNPKNPDSVISFLKENGFSKTQLEDVMENYPNLLVMNLDNNLKPKFKFFKDFGFSGSEIVGIFSKEPWILGSSLSNKIAPGLRVLNGLLGSNAEVANVLMVSNWFLTEDLEKTLVPNIEYLKSCGISMEHIFWLMHKYPRPLLCKPDIMKKYVDRIDEAGINRSSKKFVTAIRALGAMTSESWELKLQAFRDLGFSEADIATVFRSDPEVFTVSREKLKKVTELLIGTGKYGMSSIVTYPSALKHSIEKRYKPRIEVLEILERKNLTTRWPVLFVFYQSTNAQFFEKFVSPHMDEVGDVWLAKSGFVVNQKTEGEI